VTTHDGYYKGYKVVVAFSQIEVFRLIGGTYCFHLQD
jgi:hypothetical protein